LGEMNRIRTMQVEKEKGGEGAGCEREAANRVWEVKRAGREEQGCGNEKIGHGGVRV